MRIRLCSSGYCPYILCDSEGVPGVEPCVVLHPPICSLPLLILTAPSLLNPNFALAPSCLSPVVCYAASPFRLCIGSVIFSAHYIELRTAVPKFSSRKINENPPLLQLHNVLNTQSHNATSGSSDFSNTTTISNNRQMSVLQY